MMTHTFHKRIRYGEIDKMGYLYYGNYPLLYEIGRSEMIRSLGITYREMEDEWHIMMPVLSIESRYKVPLHYDENARIETMLKGVPSKMITFHHDIYNEGNVLVHKGVVKLFFIDMDSHKRVSVPHILAEKLKPYFEE